MPGLGFLIFFKFRFTICGPRHYFLRDIYIYGTVIDQHYKQRWLRSLLEKIKRNLGFPSSFRPSDAIHWFSCSGGSRRPSSVCVDHAPHFNPSSQPTYLLCNTRANIPAGNTQSKSDTETRTVPCMNTTLSTRAESRLLLKQ